MLHIPLVVFFAAVFHFAVVPGCEKPDDFMMDPGYFQVFLGEGGIIPVSGNWLVNSEPSSVWIYVMVQGKAFIRCYTN